MQTSLSQIYNDLIMMEYSGYSEMNETQKSELITKVEKMTNQYRSGLLQDYYDLAMLYHDEFIDWKLQEFEKEKIVLLDQTSETVKDALL